MSVNARSNTTGLLAFLLWNSLTNHRFTKQTIAQRMASFWTATRERYLVLIGLGSDGNVSFPMPSTRLKNALVGDLFGVAIIVLLISNLIGPIANFTTGITIAHTGFTPNPNVTSSVGLVPLVQLIPFIFVAVLVFGIFKVLERHAPSGL